MLPNVQKQLFEHIFNSFRWFPMILQHFLKVKKHFSVWRVTQKCSHTQRWECELLQEHVHAQTHAPETFQNLDKYDYRWQVGGLHLVCRLLFCCYAHTPSRTGSFPTLAPCVFFCFFFILFKWPQAHKMTPAASAKPYMFDNWTRNHTHCQFKH